jgi:hypothetical protein
MKALILALMMSLVGACGSGCLLNPKNLAPFLPKEKAIEIKIGREFNESERKLAEQALKMVAIVDHSQVYPYLPQQIYWSDMPAFYGLTVTKDVTPFYTNKIILLDIGHSRPKETNDVNQMLFFGAVLSHELHHYFHNSIDLETQLKTDAEIYKRIKGSPELLKNLLEFSKK